MSNYNERISRRADRKKAAETAKTERIEELKRAGRERVRIQLDVCQRVMDELGVEDLFNDYNQSRLRGRGVVKTESGLSVREHSGINRSDYIDPNWHKYFASHPTDTQAYVFNRIEWGGKTPKKYEVLVQATNVGLGGFKYLPDWSLLIIGGSKHIDDRSPAIIEAEFGFPNLEEVEIGDMALLTGGVEYPQERTVSERVSFFNKDFNEIREDILDGVAVALEALDKS